MRDMPRKAHVRIFEAARCQSGVEPERRQKESEARQAQRPFLERSWKNLFARAPAGFRHSGVGGRRPQQCRGVRKKAWSKLKKEYQDVAEFLQEENKKGP